MVSDDGFFFERHQLIEIEGRDLNDALRSIEAGENAFLIHLRKHAESKARIAAKLPKLFTAIEQMEIADSAGSCDLVRPPAKRI